MIKTDKGEKKNAAIKENDFVVTIGASAGGLEAIHEFFDNVPENTRVAFIIIQHLSPDYKSLLVELVAKHTQMQVLEAEHGQQLLQNSVYVIPNNKIMTLSNNRLQLADKVADKAPNTAIDTFLLSLAREKQQKSVAIILSGAGSDGSRGIEAIKEAGGMVMVQDPTTARFDGMPNSAVASGLSDYILPPELMPEELFTYMREAPMPMLKSGKVDEIILETVFKLVYKFTGVDFHAYKEATILRRISRRMAQAGCKELEEYVKYMQSHPQECKLLGKDFLIGVTRFFRDKPAFDALVNEIFPAMVSNKNDGDALKIWITACSTGEEAYSVAMMLDRFLKSKDKHLQIKIFATDVDETAIDYAARGIYPLSIAGDIDADLLEEYFTKHGKKYQVRSDLRKQIVFARHNMIKDPPFIKNDLVSCRNMLIYMSNALQEKVLNTIYYSLNPGGYLLMGPSETPSGIKDNLEEINRKWKIFRKGEDAKIVSPLALLPMPDYVKYVAKKKKTDLRKRDQPISEGLQSAFNEIIMEDMGYAALYIDKNYMVQEAAGNFKNYLSLPEKSLSLNLLKMVPGDLSIALNTAIRKAYKENKKVILHNTRIREHDRIRHINIWVKPGTPLSANPHTLIVLAENGLHYNGNGNGNGTANGNGTHDQALKEMPDNEMILDLQQELKETKLNLQAAIESMDTANEEMQSTNEELLSANEELQSSNEELQSLNEELHTLNTEHQAKINELLELNDDLNNYFRSTDIGQLFVDSSLRIRKFNPAVVKMINLIDADLGRPIGHISTNLRYGNLIPDIQKAIKTKTIVEQEIKLSNEQSTLMRIFPYVRQDKHVDGAVITFVDVTAITELNNILRGVFEASSNAILALHAVRNENGQISDFTISAANERVSSLFGKNNISLLNKSFRTELPEITNNILFDKYKQLVETDRRLIMEYCYHSQDGEKWLGIMASKMDDGFAGTFTDITEKKIAEENLRKSYNDLIQARNNLKQLNEELEFKVEERTRELVKSEERFRLVSKVTNDAIWDWNLVTNEIWISDNFYSMFGYPHESPLVKKEFWFGKLHSEDRENVVAVIDNAINEKQHQWSAEYRYCKYDGTYALILDRGYIMYNEKNEPYRVLSSMLDVTDLRKAEQEATNNMEQTRFLAESMPLMVWTATPEGEVDFLNRQFSQFTGMTVVKGKGEGWKSIVHSDSLALLRHAGKEAIVNKKDFTLEICIRRHDGEYRWHLLRARAKKDEQGNLVMWVGTNTDIHEHKMANQLLEERVKERTVALQQANQELAASNDELQQFTSVASHDLKEPLRKIHMFSNMLKEKHFAGESHPAHLYIDRIVTSTERMIQLVNDLLSFSRLSAESLFESVDLNVLLEQVLSDLEFTILEKKADVIAENLPKIDAVPGQLRQVFQNILSNALKFSKPDVHPSIHIKAERIKEKKFNSETDKAGNFYRISITDNGIGFDDKYLPKIFTIFQRLHTRQEYEGTGIGLAICKKIVEKHGGILTATSQENVGSTFIIVLPVRQGA